MKLTNFSKVGTSWASPDIRCSSQSLSAVVGVSIKSGSISGSIQKTISNEWSEVDDSSFEQTDLYHEYNITDFHPCQKIRFLFNVKPDYIEVV